jgi:hypothetical protein
MIFCVRALLRWPFVHGISPSTELMSRHHREMRRPRTMVAGAQRHGASIVS